MQDYKKRRKCISLTECFNMAKKKEPKYTDYVDFTQKAVDFLDAEQTELGVKYGEIIHALREQNMTAKELHYLYLDEDTGKYSCTLKTVYRHLEKLEKAGLVTVCGHRSTEGKSLTEKLYARTAKTFFKSMNERRDAEALKKRTTDIEKLYTILSEVLDSDIIDYNEFSDILNLFFDYELDGFNLLAEKAPDSERLQRLYSEIDIKYVNYLNDFVARLLAFILNPELIEGIQKINKN